ncbi:uncharacterized protein L969DRAFT_83903 [Mixia osmundae IAM 14324]|uniref:Uncharacterized protein n=1 Tax=Mixia osmundae (strain CBS 9802 / IAM 14324 / JCM 22182 / KY 12970) TaxID=764103 RepID=G7DVC2_MIXOS|nr:uncharacterized protein L969DRAFT_83903 [Mixia osmundae IAM 14324]KEI42047.1 hypothetical protein L969DRAFT_83903 [Mixia osmundae IAM 14324]GAA94532.1 hypothetical protein E5Q_01184 [Mixia osmundae IAM 14324]
MSAQRTSKIKADDDLPAPGSKSEHSPKRGTRQGRLITQRSLLAAVGCLVALLFLTFALGVYPFDLKHEFHPIHRSRPHFKKVPRYSKEHRFRPAASPVITQKASFGRVKLHGEYVTKKSRWS